MRCIASPIWPLGGGALKFSAGVTCQYLLNQARSSPDPVLMLWHNVVNDRRLGEEVVGNRLEIAVAQIFEAVLDGLPHRTLDPALLGRGAGLQELNNITLFPLADPGARIGRDIGNELAVGSIRRPGQLLTGPHGAEEIARGVALAAMRERGDEVSASIISDTSFGCRVERARGEEQQLPAGCQEAPGKPKGHVVWPVLLAHRG